MAISKVQIVSIWALPLLLTALSGSLYQVANLAGANSDYIGLLDMHKGNFGPLKLVVMYPFINSYALLMLSVTGITMWLQIPWRKHS